ncbi:hypothetical protein [Marinobacterium stanieri]|uniref:hypothetical protein n=1 Tax=Marinobacterium stanieri TaxID=49186 RepID=UPI00031D68C7|nr:hypothetical protein [Marinobacterium stanieri]
MTDTNKQPETGAAAATKVTVKVTAKDGVTFKRKPYKEGESIKDITPGQAKILRAQRVVE